MVKKKGGFSPDSLKKILPTCDTDVSSWVTHRKPESGRLVNYKTSSAVINNIWHTESHLKSNKCIEDRVKNDHQVNCVFIW